MTKLVDTHPELARQWDKDKNVIDLKDARTKDKKKRWWIGDCGHNWDTATYSRTRDNSGCPYCSGQRVLAGFNDLATLYPGLADEWDDDNPITATEVSAGSHKKFSWVGKECGHVWIASPDNRVRGGTGCPYCAGKKILPGFNDLKTLHPGIAEQWDYDKNTVSPDEVSPGSHKKFWWVCSSQEHHSWEATPKNRTLRNSGCPYCSNHKTDTGTNDITVLFPHLMEEWDFDSNVGVNPETLSKSSHYNAHWVCEDGHKWTAHVSDRTIGKGCRICANKVSKGETELADYVKSILPGIPVLIGNRKIISPYELDIYIPSLNVAIEFNGVYWHSEKMGKDKNYHHEKWLRCRESGVQLITVWEDDWRERQEIVKSMISHKLGVSSQERVYARKTTVVEVPFEQAKEFLDNNHIQGKVSGSVYLGLEYDNDIVAVSVWRKNKNTLYLDRYATSAPVIGGMGKLLKEGKRWGEEHQCEEIVTFANHEVSDGGLYEKLGFTKDRELVPDYSYVVGTQRIHKFNYRLKRFRDDPGLTYQDGLTENELASLNGLWKVWDSGKTRYVMPLTSP